MLLFSTFWFILIATKCPGPLLFHNLLIRSSLSLIHPTCLLKSTKVPTNCRLGGTLRPVSPLYFLVSHVWSRGAGQSGVDIMNYRDVTLNLNHTYNLLFHRTACHKKTFFTIEASLRMDSTTCRPEHPKQIWLVPLIFLMKSVNHTYWVVSLNQVTIPRPTSWDSFQSWQARYVNTTV